jgi:polyhydroxyalkanoate synthase
MQTDAFRGPAGLDGPALEEFAKNLARLVEESGKAWAASLRRLEQGEIRTEPPEEVVDLVRVLGELAQRWVSDPVKSVAAGQALATGYLDLWTSTWKRFAGEDVPPVAVPEPGDRRFNDPDWSSVPYFDFLKQAYLHTSRWANAVVQDADLDAETRQKADFYVRQLSNAVAPSNFVLTNPELLRETIAAKGANLVRGMRMLAEDIEAGGGELKIRQSDASKFKVGENLAVTPGKVIFQNDLFQLLQYSASTEKVRRRPILIVPPWINKFYILDLSPEKSFIKWAVDQGLTVFCISWVNPDERHAKKTFVDYMDDGVLTAIDKALKAARVDSLDAVGYCVGGTLLAVALGSMAAKGDTRIAGASFLTTQVDFAHAGDLKVFVDEEQLTAIEKRMEEQGYLESRKMASAFNMLRSNDLIWPYVINNYLRGQAPFPFDLLHWNSDSTRLPAANHAWYLRTCYLENRLGRGALEIGGVSIDLSRVTMPTYSLATREDHIAPAKSVFVGMQLFGGPQRFVVAGSGHIAGVVNPPARGKYQYWIGPPPKGDDLDGWIAAAEEHPGSWWPDWRAWLDGLDSTTVKARKPGGGRFKPIENAPGSYVKVQA